MNPTCQRAGVEVASPQPAAGYRYIKEHGSAQGIWEPTNIGVGYVAAEIVAYMYGCSKSSV
jgi:hypothetical protein